MNPKLRIFDYKNINSMDKKTTIYFQGIRENHPYGIPFEWKEGDLMSMNLFIGYIIQNQFEIRKKLKKEWQLGFLETVQTLDEYEVVNFHNLELFDTSNINFNCLILKKFSVEINVRFENVELVFPEGKSVIFTNRDMEIPTKQLKQYEGNIVGIEVPTDTRLIFMTEEQISRNYMYIYRLIQELFKPLSIDSSSPPEEIAQLFKVV